MQNDHTCKCVGNNSQSITLPLQVDVRVTLLLMDTSIELNGQLWILNRSAEIKSGTLPVIITLIHVQAANLVFGLSDS